jgi:hypothetical protein
MTSDRGADLSNRLRTGPGRPALARLTAAACLASAVTPLFASDAAALAKAAQNPVASMVSVPFQYNANLNVGPDKRTQHVLNIQPVVPFRLNADWNLITRTIVPIASLPGPGADRTAGVGDLQLSLFLSPARPQGWIWGAGAVVQAPTATDDLLGQGKWGLGPAAVALRMSAGSPWVYGALINNVWSVGGESNRPDVNQMTLQPIVNYNFPDAPGRYLNFSPVVTANWNGASGQKWTVPLGLGIGQIMKFGDQPMNLQAAAYYNVARPDGASNWNLRLQIQWLFPR